MAFTLVRGRGWPVCFCALGYYGSRLMPRKSGMRAKELFAVNGGFLFCKIFRIIVTIRTRPLSILYGSIFGT